MTNRKLRHDELLAARLTIAEAQSATTQRHPVSLLLHNIRSLYNVGSIFRTADAGLAQHLHLAGYTPHPPRKEIEKTALGAVETVPWTYHQHTLDAVRALRTQGVTVLALELTPQSRSIASPLAFSVNDFPLCLVLGNEITGVDDEVLRECDGAVAIPMYGVKHSLNVGVATGIALFFAVEAWKHHSSKQVGH
jgi:23S rRNA (guanosine2251-2'-O)-methyltransferase